MEIESVRKMGNTYIINEILGVRINELEGSNVGITLLYDQDILSEEDANELANDFINVPCENTLK